VDLSLFKRRNFALGTLAFCLGYAVFFANNLLMPLWLQTQVGYTATWAGLVAAPGRQWVAVLLTPLSAKMMSKFDARIIASLAFVAFGISFLMRSRFTNEASLLEFIFAASGAGRRSGDLLPSHDHHPAGRRAAAEDFRWLPDFPISPASPAAVLAASIVTTLWDRREALQPKRLADTPPSSRRD